jgi:hypothetical protein
MTSIAPRRLGNLNGWQRLWVVVSILAGLAVAIMSASNWPQGPCGAVECETLALQFGGQVIQSEGTYSIVTKDGIKLYGVPEHLPADAPELKAKVTEIRAAASRAKIDHVLTSLGLWLAVVCGTYALGWSVAWVRRGFRNER